MNNDTTIDIDVIPDTGEVRDDESQDELEDLEEKYDTEVVDYSKTLIDLKKDRITIPYLTKYERTQLISARAQQLSMGAIPTVEVKDMKDTVCIAEKELMERKIPLIIRRKLPNNVYEDWKIEELIIDI